MCNHTFTSWRCGCIRFSDWTLCENANREECEFATTELVMVEAGMCTGCREAFLALPSAQRLLQLQRYNEQACEWNQRVQDENFMRD